MAGRVCYPVLRYGKLTHKLQSYRTFLSAAYRCEDAWSKRLKSQLLLGINASDYSYDLDRKFKREGKVSAIDVDLFVNKLEPTYARSLTQDLEELVNRLRRSPETINTLPSTPHAALRILLDTKRTKLLLKFLANPLEYGIFPDHYMNNVLMDTFIKEKNYTAAARVASVLMLQEDFGPPLTQVLAIASCYSYLKSEENLPWEDYTVKLEEPEEEVKIKIPYLRNPYFDDHFDLKDPNHIVGKTLAWGAPLVGGEIGLSCEILGWATYNKWNDLANAFRNATEGTTPIASSVINSVKEIVAASESCESREDILALVTRLESSSSRVVDLDLESLIQDLAQKEAAKTEADDIKAQEEIYASWEKRREEEVHKQLEEYRKKQLLAEIEEKKRDLAAQEDVIFFFDNKDRLEMLLDKKPTPMEKPRRYFFPQKKMKPKKVDEDYIPPEVRRR